MDNQQSTKYKPTVVQKNGGKKEREGLSTTAGRRIWKKSNISDINLIHLDDKTTQKNCSS